MSQTDKKEIPDSSMVYIRQYCDASKDRVFFSQKIENYFEMFLECFLKCLKVLLLLYTWEINIPQNFTQRRTGFQKKLTFLFL